MAARGVVVRRRRRACGRARRGARRRRPRRTTVSVRARPRRRLSLVIANWRSAKTATCGRCVMQTIWVALGERRQALAEAARRDAADAGVDLVEDQRVARRGPGARGRLMASMARESSPPEAVSRSGRGGTPGLAPKRRTRPRRRRAARGPRQPSPRGCRRRPRSAACGMARPRSSSATLRGEPRREPPRRAPLSGRAASAAAWAAPRRAAPTRSDSSAAEPLERDEPLAGRRQRRR